MFFHSLEHPEKLIHQDVGKNHCSTHRVFELNMNFQMLLFFVRPYDISRFLRFRTICFIFRQISFLHIFVHGVYMKLDNISFSSPKIICVKTVSERVQTDP